MYPTILRIMRIRDVLHLSWYKRHACWLVNTTYSDFVSYLVECTDRNMYHGQMINTWRPGDEYVHLWTVPPLV